MSKGGVRQFHRPSTGSSFLQGDKIQDVIKTLQGSEGRHYKIHCNVGITSYCRPDITETLEGIGQIFYQKDSSDRNKRHYKVDK